MAKREFIEKRSIVDTVCEGISCNECSFNTTQDGQCGCGLEEHIFALDTITEQDIVKPYLAELIKKLEPIKECEFQIYGKESWNFVGKCQDKIQDMIDNLLSEQGDTDGEET